MFKCIILVKSPLETVCVNECKWDIFWVQKSKVNERQSAVWCHKLPKDVRLGSRFKDPERWVKWELKAIKNKLLHVEDVSFWFRLKCGFRRKQKKIIYLKYFPGIHSMMSEYYSRDMFYWKMKKVLVVYFILLRCERKLIILINL